MIYLRIVIVCLLCFLVSSCKQGEVPSESSETQMLEIDGVEYSEQTVREYLYEIFDFGASDEKSIIVFWTPESKRIGYELHIFPGVDSAAVTSQVRKTFDQFSALTGIEFFESATPSDTKMLLGVSNSFVSMKDLSFVRYMELDLYEASEEEYLADLKNLDTVGRDRVTRSVFSTDLEFEDTYSLIKIKESHSQEYLDYLIVKTIYSMMYVGRASSKKIESSIVYPIKSSERGKLSKPFIKFVDVELIKLLYENQSLSSKKLASGVEFILDELIKKFGM